jgi:phosphate/sulfate permease
MPDFIAIAALVGLGMLIWDCIEVGRNDAANLVNAVFGARVMRRRVAVAVAAVAVVLGATFSSPVMETARKGIFDPTVLTVQVALAIYISVYFVDTVLLYGFSGFGMPVSTTACLVFELVGASLFLAGLNNVNWSKVGDVVTAILMSIVISGIAAFMIMRVFRGAVRDRVKDRETILLHGPWISGAIFTWLTWFMVFKGLKNVELIQSVREHTFEIYGQFPVLILTWGAYTLLVHLLLVATHGYGHRYLFSVTAVLGMICMAFAFGQNDLANAASPGLAGLTLWRSGTDASQLADIASKVPIPWWALFGCGALIASGMFTSYAQRVTRAEVNTGSQFDHVALYAPGWCRWIARVVLRARPSTSSLAPEPSLTETGKKMHYDTLRASVITGVSASVIALASGRGLPVSTTYVAFAAVVGSGMADRVFARGDADRKVGRAIWVVSCWFLAPVIAIVATGCIATLVYHLSVVGLAFCLVLNIAVRLIFRRRADAHERKHHRSDDDQPETPTEGDSQTPQATTEKDSL